MSDKPERLPFPKSGECACGASDWLDCEAGYVRMSSAAVDGGVIRVFMDGWDDMSEGGDEQYMACAVCGREYAYPDMPAVYE